MPPAPVAFLYLVLFKMMALAFLIQNIAHNLHSTHASPLLILLESCFGLITSRHFPSELWAAYGAGLCLVFAAVLLSKLSLKRKRRYPLK